jgi:hypothetical protein
MNMVIAALIFVALLSVSVAHLAWSLGLTWPIREEKLLAQTVIGRAGIERMPPRWATFAVFLLTLSSGIIALALADHTSGGAGLTVLSVPLACVFGGRGVLGYTRWWAEMTPEPNFRTNDRRVYSPLCLAIGLGFLILFLMRLI